MHFLTLAFIMGLFGSLHCVAMCGPLILAMPVDGRSNMRDMVNKLIYQVGRIAVYGFLGLAIGVVGNMLAIKGMQQYASLFTAALLLTVAALQLLGKRTAVASKWQQALLAPVIEKFGYWLHHPRGHFIAGMLNGFLPCGMVYMGLAAAANADGPMNGMYFMLLFGLGTWPLTLGTALFGNVIKRSIPINMHRWLSVMLLVMGIWFLLRGANLDIPYLSPVIYPEGAATCSQ